MSIKVKDGSNAPIGDGDINRYISAEGSQQSWFNRSREVVFINGMANSPKNHMESALGLSLIQGCPVVGVYNQTNGFWADLGQCLRDKGVLVFAQAGDYDSWETGFNIAYQAAKLKYPSVSKVDFMEGLISGNPATVSLYRYVCSRTSRQRDALKLFAHSQGNLITSNALTAVALALGKNAIRGMEVYSFGSPSRFWPPGITRYDHSFTFDPVSWLNYRHSFKNIKVGFTPGLISHGFEVYMNQDAEFVVNRFRWGAFRMTASMDEDGLAEFLTTIGNNPPRLTKIFNWLVKHHYSDSDDIAVQYTEKMQAKHGALMASIARSDPAFVRLLIACMEDGRTFPDERRAITYLEGLI
ncbi:hypothetical protein SAMN04488515_0586 [Cognatiyoonia koreensis]|uniref:Uncharacterized protein n=1 Tax=Cognatiyoonia koreensis TaxID=364200 RepID=A0A1I0NG44_9RHOB|nr:hypothetical protein [Cognatiyoonia koreensis]SEW00028.1 hypothetical protein SAMN04488515_0586 [Cognatiyoonia koreensis]